MKLIEIIRIIPLLFILILLLFYTHSVLQSIFYRIPVFSSRSKKILAMIAVAHLKKDDLVYDFGSGYGKLLFLIEKQTKISGVGFENNLLPFLLSKIKKKFKKSEVVFSFKNFYNFKVTDKEAKIFVYLTPRELNRLFFFLKKNKFKGLVICNTFSASNFQAEKIFIVPKSKNRIYTYRF